MCDTHVCSNEVHHVDVVTDGRTIFGVVVGSHYCQRIHLTEGRIETRSRNSAVLCSNLCRRELADATQGIRPNYVKISEDDGGEIVVGIRILFYHLLGSELGRPIRTHGVLRRRLSDRHLFRVAVGRARAAVDQPSDPRRLHPLEYVPRVGCDVLIVQQRVLESPLDIRLGVGPQWPSMGEGSGKNRYIRLTHARARAYIHTIQ